MISLLFCFLGIFLASSIYYISVINFGKYSDFNFIDISLLSFSLLLWDPNFTYVRLFDIVSHIFWMMCPAPHPHFSMFQFRKFLLHSVPVHWSFNHLCQGYWWNLLSACFCSTPSFQLLLSTSFHVSVEIAHGSCISCTFHLGLNHFIAIFNTLIGFPHACHIWIQFCWFLYLLALCCFFFFVWFIVLSMLKSGHSA